MIKSRKNIFSYLLTIGQITIPFFSLSCSSYDSFDYYANINFVLEQREGWNQTLFSQFGNSSVPNQFPEKWGYRYTNAHRTCGSKKFTWKESYDGVQYCDNSQDGYLQLNYNQATPWTDPNDSTWTTNNFSGSIYTNQFEQAFGYWEVNAKFLDKHFGWSTFWLQCNSEGKIGNGGRDGSEIDIFESFNWGYPKNIVQMDIHADGYGQYYKTFSKSCYYVNSQNEPINIYDDFHNYGLLWTPNAYYMYIDHNLVFKTTAKYCTSGYGLEMGVCQVPCYAILSGHMGPSDSGKNDNISPSGLIFDAYDGPGKFLVKSFSCYQNDHFIPYIKTPSDFN